jgi:Holliday junction resolvase
MASTPESKVKARAVKQLKALGAYYFFPIGGAYGKAGVPDIICCYRGKFFAFECKAGYNKPTQLQKINIDEIIRCGGTAMVINEDNVDIIHGLLTTWN